MHIYLDITVAHQSKKHGAFLSSNLPKQWPGPQVQAEGKAFCNFREGRILILWSSICQHCRVRKILRVSRIMSNQKGSLNFLLLTCAGYQLRSWTQLHLSPPTVRLHQAHWTLHPPISTFQAVQDGEGEPIGARRALFCRKIRRCCQLPLEG